MNRFLTYLILLIVASAVVGCGDDYTGFVDVEEKHHFIEPKGFERSFLPYKLTYKLPKEFNITKYGLSGSCTTYSYAFSFYHFSKASDKTILLPDTVDHSGWFTPDSLRYGNDSIVFQIHLPEYFEYKDSLWHKEEKEFIATGECITSMQDKLKAENTKVQINELNNELKENNGEFKIMEYGYANTNLNKLIAYYHSQDVAIGFFYTYPKQDSISHRNKFLLILKSFNFEREKSSNNN